MKKVLPLWLLLLANWLHAQTDLKNLDFETLSDTSITGFADWKCYKYDHVAPDAEVKHSGNYSLKLDFSDGGPFSAFLQHVPFISDTAHPVKVTLSGWIKREDVANFTGLWVRVMSGRKMVAFDNMNSKMIQGTADWEQVSVHVIVDGGATDLFIGGLIGTRGVVWFDDFSVKIESFTPQPLPDSLSTYLDEALDIMQKNALNRDSVDWPALREKTKKTAAEASSYSDCYPAIKVAIQQLNDHHSFLMPASDSKKWSDDDKSEEIALASGEILDNGIAYISMPGLMSGNEHTLEAYANQLQQLIKNLDQRKVSGWVLDLRYNNGGNCWPMLAGIGPLLGGKICGYFLAKGEPPTPWKYENGASYSGDALATKISREPYITRKKMPKVAVLTGPGTASSGEVVVVAFRNRPNCRSFGEATAGLSTGNANFTLRDGAQIFLANCVYADRLMNRYGSRITPDEVITAPNAQTDPVIQAAVQWLKQ